jgi:tRNA U34 5-carboxymethylaminomethyl modifying GTPase MnmE/TrmE
LTVEPVPGSEATAVVGVQQVDVSVAEPRLAALIEEGAHAEVLSVEARAAADALGKITGRSIADGLLETIFSKFCIGK